MTMSRLALIGGAVLFLAGAVFGGVVSQGSGGTISSPEPTPTVTQTVTKTVTKYALTPECEEALRQAEVVLDAGMQVSGNLPGIEQIIADSKRYIAVNDVAGLSKTQAELIDYEKTNTESFHALGIESFELDKAITNCTNS